ncbi:hypothetical protein RvY_03881-2 [Ramazzottius varieornatus]|uniref:G-protein coupled receptors family 1 profile domain-containing protein n=1 Tax=Ramazzottius varieornatus TaxID=947166 RepID=A0A1D1UPL1_RAMVA|nr:hypothetical protein RvY_03881-2 [Ramazzottius varieornatus]
MVQSAKCVLSEHLCTMYGFVIAWSGIGCIFSIAVISYEWYRKLICLSRSRNSRANWHIVVRLGSIWFASFVVTCPPLFGWNRYTVEGYAMPCSVDWESTLLTDRLYVAYMFTLGLFIPLAVVLFSYGNIIRIMRTIADRRATSCPHMAAFVSRHHIRMMQMLFAMLLAFCVTWIPYGIHCLIIVFGHKKILSEDGAIFIMMLAKASIGTYPVIYACMNNEVRMR